MKDDEDFDGVIEDSDIEDEIIVEGFSFNNLLIRFFNFIAIINIFFF